MMSRRNAMIIRSQIELFMENITWLLVDKNSNKFQYSTFVHHLFIVYVFFKYSNHKQLTNTLELRIGSHQRILIFSNFTRTQNFRPFQFLAAVSSKQR